MQQETVLRLVDLLYAAAIDETQWPQFLHALAKAVDGTGADLAWVRFEGRAPNLLAGVGVFGPDFRREYQAFGHEDPWLLRAQREGIWRAGTIGIGEQLVPMRELERTGFYNDFGRRHDYVGGLTSVVAADETGLAAISVCRRKDSWFGQAEVDLMRVLMPHMTRALQVHARFVAAEAREHGLRNALDRLAAGAMVVAKDGAILFVNSSALEILAKRDGLAIDRGALCAACVSDTKKLRTLIASAGEISTEPRVVTGGALRLNRPSGQRPLQVVVAPVAARNSFAEASAHVLVFLTDPECSPQADLDLLRRLHGLSRAEGRVAQLLVEDRTVLEIGDLLGVTVNTVRFHLKQLFSKTRTRRQSELVHLLLSTAQLRRT